MLDSLLGLLKLAVFLGGSYILGYFFLWGTKGFRRADFKAISRRRVMWIGIPAFIIALTIFSAAWKSLTGTFPSLP